MTPEDALKVADEVLFTCSGRTLTDIQRLILRESLSGKGYEDIEGYTTQHIKNAGKILWDLLTDALGEKVSKTNFKGALEKRWVSQDIIHKPLNLKADKADISVVENKGYFYVVRSRLEQRCYEEVAKVGSLIRIKSPERMGKSMMMGRVLKYATQQGYRTAAIDLREANREIFADINKFLQWFCAYVGDCLEIEQRPEDAWKGFLGANTNCTKYVEKFFLNRADSPLVISIDNFDCVFKYPDIETDFCSLLRGWFEKVNTSKVWGKLRQMIVYSQESYAAHNINQSPFNVGLPIELGELESSEVLALTNAYGLPWDQVETNQLMNTIGGHPYLVQKAIDQIAHEDIGLEELVRTAPTEEGIFGDYLNERLQQLEANPDLVAAMLKVVNADGATRLGSKETFKLDSMGLIKRQGNDIVSRCNLYRLYFKDRLS